MNQINNLIVIPSLGFWWWTENLCSTLWIEFYNKWYNIQYFTFYDKKDKYQFKWEEYCLSESKTNVLWNIYKLFKRAFEIKKYCKKYWITKCLSFISDANFSTIISRFFWNKSKIYISVEYSIDAYNGSLYHCLIKLLYKYADKIIVHTQYEYDNLIKNYKINNDNVVLIPNFIDINNIQKLFSEKLDMYEKLFENGKFSFISIWSLKKVKNQEFMIKTFNKLNEKYKNIQLIILWDWKNKESLKKIANGDVHFLWAQKNVFKFLSKSNCFLLTSKSESFSIAILEAMVSNLPIISTRTQWPTEILDNGIYGILVEDSEKDLYSAMERILINKKLRDYYRQKSNERVQIYKKECIIGLWETVFNE